MAGRGHLAARLPARQIAARVRGRGVKLQGLQRQVFEERHGVLGVLKGINFRQYTGSNCQAGSRRVIT